MNYQEAKIVLQAALDGNEALAEYCEEANGLQKTEAYCREQAQALRLAVRAVDILLEQGAD